MYNLLICFSLLTSFITTENSKLTIEIQNIEVLEGNIRIGIFNTSEDFLKQGFSFKNYILAVNNTTIPKEPFGFSNNVKPKMAKPTFEECKFSLTKDRVMKINLGYFN